MSASPALSACSTVKTRWWSMIPALSFYVRRRDCIVSFFLAKMPELLPQLGRKIHRPSLEPPSLVLASEVLQYLNRLNAIQTMLSSEDQVTSTKVLSSLVQIKSLTVPCQVDFNFPRLTEILGEITVWSKAAFFDPKGIRVLSELQIFDTVKARLEVDLDRLLPNSVSDTLPANPFQNDSHSFASILTVIASTVELQDVEHYDCLRFFSESILPNLSKISVEKCEAVQRLLSLLFSIPATQISCERVFSKASKACSSKSDSIGSQNLSDIVMIQKAFPNTVEGLLKAMNAVRTLGRDVRFEEENEIEIQ